MKMERRTFRIGELTRVLSENGPEIEPSVIRFWEKEFAIKPKRSDKGQRYYDEQDLSRFIKIRELLYDKRFTIEGARQALFSPQNTQTLPQPEKQLKKPGDWSDQGNLLGALGRLRNQLEKLRDLL